MSDFAANLDPTALGLPSEADLVAAFRATPGYEAMAKAEAEKQARIAAYKAANPGASDFAARYYGGTDEDRARIQAMYPGTFGKLHKSMYYSGAAPAEGQSVLDYMLANNGAMPETKVKEGPGLGQALLNAAMLAAAGFGVGTIGNALMAGAGAAGAGGAGAAGAGAAGAGGAGAAGAAIPSTVAGLVPTSTALGAGSAAAQMGATLAGGLGAAGTAGTLAAAAPTVSELVITAAAGGMTVPQIAAVVGIPALAVANVLQGSSGLDVAQGGEAGDTLSQPGEGTTVDELVITADKLNPATWTDLVPVGTIGSGILAKGVADGLGVPQSSAAGETPTNSDIPSDVEGLKTTADALGPGSPAGKLAEGTLADKALKWAKEHPDLVAKGIAPLIGAGAAGGGSTTGGGIPPGFATAGTPGSLSDKFRAQLPAPSGPFGNLAGRDVSMTPEEWKTYGARPEQSFFANVPIRPSGIIDTSKRAPVNPGLNPAEAEPGFKAKVTPDVRVAPGYWPEPNSPTQPVSGANQPYDPMAEERAYWEARERQRAEREGRPYVPASNGKALAMERLGGAPATAPTSTSTGFNPSAVIPDYMRDDGFNQPGNNLAPFAVALDKLRGRQAQPLPAPSKGFKVGGFAVRGPGTGRSDDIPARLSDGEYVIDAETVALLGDGSSQAGSKRLDEFRANIRKHKGRQLAKGKFSHDARKPEAYLHGGQV